jgi:hypothetical protein
LDVRRASLPPVEECRRAIVQMTLKPGASTFMVVRENGGGSDSQHPAPFACERCHPTRHFIGNSLSKEFAPARSR